MEWLRSLWLGVVQGITEFLPISSDGHLALFQILTAGPDGLTAESGAEHLFFDVMLHLGTAAAILVHYRRQVLLGVHGFLGATDVPEGFRRAELIRVGVLVFVATLPLVPDALFLKDWLDAQFQSLWSVGVGFAITAAVLLVTTRLKGGPKGPATMTWLDALLIGVAQAFAPLPGVSRSGLTIATALALGLNRTWAVGFSLMMAVPAIFGAAVFEIRKVDPGTLSADRIAQTVAATIVAGIVGYMAILWLVRVVRSGRLWYFSVYLIVVSTLALVLASRSGGGGPTDAGPTRAVDRPAPLGSAGNGPGRVPAGAGPALDRADAAGPRAGDLGHGARSRDPRVPAGLHLG